VIRRARGPILGGGAAALLLTGALSACATTYDTSATTVPATSSTVFVPTGSTAELLTAITDEAGTLSEQLVDNDGQRATLARIQAQWEVVRPVIEADRPELLNGFDMAIAHVGRSVERRRPADADKAAKNLAVLVAAFEG
jgi:hypothetical protein